MSSLGPAPLFPQDSRRAAGTALEGQPCPHSSQLRLCFSGSEPWCEKTSSQHHVVWTESPKVTEGSTEEPLPKIQTEPFPPFHKADQKKQVLRNCARAPLKVTQSWKHQEKMLRSPAVFDFVGHHGP